MEYWVKAPGNQNLELAGSLSSPEDKILLEDKRGLSKFPLVPQHPQRVLFCVSCQFFWRQKQTRCFTNILRETETDTGKQRQRDTETEIERDRDRETDIEIETDTGRDEERPLRDKDREMINREQSSQTTRDEEGCNTPGWGAALHTSAPFRSPALPS